MSEFSKEDYLAGMEDADRLANSGGPVPPGRDGDTHLQMLIRHRSHLRPQAKETVYRGRKAKAATMQMRAGTARIVIPLLRLARLRKRLQTIWKPFSGNGRSSSTSVTGPKKSRTGTASTASLMC